MTMLVLVFVTVLVLQPVPLAELVVVVRVRPPTPLPPPKPHSPFDDLPDQQLDGMAHSMEGRFPLASKIFMQYCLDIPTKHKVGSTSDHTKLLIKKAYRNILPDEVIGKSKTGWTVPVGYWLADKHDVELEAFYKSAMGSEILDKVSSNQKASKRLIPKWLVKDWRTEYDIK